MLLKNISELVEKTKSGEIDENKLSIVLDNDCVCFYYNFDGENYDFEIHLEEEGEGYQDILPLYKLVFPKSNVEWC